MKILKAGGLALLLLNAGLLPAQNAEQAENKQAEKKDLNEKLSKSAFVFIENQGQYADANGKPFDGLFFYGTSRVGSLCITDKGLTYIFEKWGKDRMEYEPGEAVNDPKEENGKPEGEWCKVEMTLQGASIKKENIFASDTTADYYNYYYSHCPDGILNVHSYKTITIRSVYAGIDWVIYCNGQQGVKYDFIVHPGADPSQICLSYKGATAMSLLNDGAQLKMETPLGDLVEGKLITYEQESGNYVKSSFLLKENVVRFKIANYNKDEVLVIDPPMVWGTYNGGTSNQGIMDLARTSGSNSDLFAVGYTNGSDIGAMNPGGGAYYQGTNAGLYDACIFKFNNWGTRLWTTYYGGAQDDVAWSAVVQGTNVFVVGNTASSAFPLQTSPAPQQSAYAGPVGSSSMTYHSGSSVWGGDAFFLQFQTSGVRTYGTYWGGSAADGARAVTVDANGNAIVVGNTLSTNFPAINASQGTNGGNSDAFMAIFAPSSYTCNMSTYLGGTTNDYAWSVACNRTGTTYAYVVGETAGSFPGIVNAFQSSFGGGSYDGFVTKYNITTTTPSIVWNSYYGSSGNDVARACLYAAPGGIDRLYVAEEASASGLSTYGTYVYQGGIDVHFISLDPTTTTATIKWGGYFGTSNGTDIPYDLALDPNSSNYVYLVGMTNGTSFNPIVTDITSCSSYNQATNAGGVNTYDGFIIRMDPPVTPAVTWATYYGGTSVNADKDDFLRTDIVDATGCLFVAGEMHTEQLGTPAEVFNYGAGTYYDGVYGTTGTNGLHDQSLAKFCNCPAAYLGPDITINSCCAGTIGPNNNPSGCFTYQWSTGATTAQISVSPMVATSYTLTVTGPSGCQSSDVITVFVNTSNTACCRMINPDTPAENTTMNLYPNPTGGQFTVQLPDNAEENAAVYVVDAAGRTVIKEREVGKEKEFQMDLSAYPRGIYFVEMRRPSGEIIVRKILIQ